MANGKWQSELGRTERIFRVDLFRRTEHLQRAPFADEPREALRSAPAGDQSERRTTMSEDGVGRGNPDIASQRQVQPAAHAVAGNGSDGQGGEVVDQVR